MRVSLSRLLHLPSNPKATPFEIFSLPSSATPKQIKSRYYELVRIYHPDKAPTQDAQKRTKDFQMIVKAYELLSDAKKKQLYVDTGSGWSDPFGDTQKSKWQSDMDFVKQHYGHRRSSHSSDSYRPPFSKKSGGWDGEFYWSAYHHPAYGKHKPVYGSNGVFISGLIFFSALVTLIEYHTFLPTSMIRNSLSRTPDAVAIDEWQFKANIDANRSLSNAHESRRRHGLARMMAARKHVLKEQEDAQPQNLQLKSPHP